MKKRRSMLSFFCLCLALFLLSSFPASANSAQYYWEGVDRTGAVVCDEACPLVVEKELLTLDIAAFPANYYDTLEDFLAYDGRVTAEYTFYNPSELEATVTLAFPFGALPSYGAWGVEADALLTADAARYDILVGGETVEKTVRYTLSSGQFSLEEDLPRLREGYAADEFFSPTLTVTKYTLKVSGLDFEAYPAAHAAVDVAEDMGARRFYFPTQSGAHMQKDGSMRVSVGADDLAELYVFGEPLSVLPDIAFYQDGGVENGEEIAGHVSIFEVETMTFEAFALSNWQAERGVSTVDWYNALVDELNGSLKYTSHPVLSCSRFQNAFHGSLMRWYMYEISLAPGERLVNSVTAPLYPSIDTRYIPAVCAYTYLLSPARGWADFGRLDIVINTPYYLVESSIRGFEKTENGYRFSQSGLPLGELTLSLSTSEAPEKRPSYSGGSIEIYEYWPLGAIALAVAVPSAFCLLVSRRKRITRDKEGKE